MADRRINREQGARRLADAACGWGEEAAVAETLRPFRQSGLQMAFQSMPTRAEAEDAVQEIFVRRQETADRWL